ncbi:MAG: UvrD-helicase domain-containing protein [Spirochaetia bacterium]|nr:UvrD-helicase domain-containing protein [Spirochaetia bacterium]
MLADQKIRDEIIHYDGSAFVLAGAGTGKSTIIADKIIWLLENKKIQSLKNIAAITYTNKAAAELKWKIEDKLHAKLQTLNSECPGVSRSIFETALNSLNESSIGTIHSFCAKIIRTFGYYNKMDPVFSIISKDEGEYLLRETFLEYIGKKVEDNKTSPVATSWKSIVKYGDHSSLDELTLILESAIEKIHHLEFTSSENFPVQNENDLLSFQKIIFNEYISGFLNMISFYDYEKEAAQKENSLGSKIKNLMDLFKSETDLYERIDYYSEDIHPGTLRGSVNFIINNGDKNTNSILKTYLKIISEYKTSGDFKINDEIKNYFRSARFPDYSGISASAIESEYLRFLWFQAVKDFQEYFLEQKKCQSSLGYSDIILMTHKLLENELVTSNLKGRYKYIFVDEYQDTDPLQTAIFARISSVLPDENNLFDAAEQTRLIRVGDAKQSIYSFRGADLETFYREHKAFKINSSGYCGSLMVNMRSHPAIISFVNRLFSPTHNKPLPMDIEHYESLIAGALPQKMPEPGVYISVFSEQGAEQENKGEKKKARTLRKQEAVWLADEIEKTRNARQDISICVLFLSMKDNLQPYVEELGRKKIPCQLLGRRYYGENLTKKYLMLFLNVLYNKADTLSLGGFLRSPVGGFTDMEVHKIFSSGLANSFLKSGAFHPDLFPEGLFSNDSGKRVQTAMAAFQTALGLAQNSSISSMLWYIFENMDFLPFTSLLSNSEIIRESIDRIIDLAAMTDSMSFSSFSKKIKFFMEEVDQLENIPEVDEPAETFNNSGVVQIMSYHKCKGLEFDVIFMPDLTYSRKNHKSGLYIESLPEQSGVIFQYQNDLSFHHISMEDAQSFINKKNAAEQIRLVYVAMTRAKERLYLPLYPPPKSGNSIYSILIETLEHKFHLKKNLEQASDQWTEISYDPSTRDTAERATYFLQKYNPVLEEKDEEANPFIFPKPGQKTNVKINTANMPPSYKFVSGTSILKKLNRENQPEFLPPEFLPKESEDLLIAGEIENNTGDHGHDHFFQAALRLNGAHDAMERGIIAHSVFEWIDLYNPVITETVLNAIYFEHASDGEGKSALKKYAEELAEIYRNSRLFELIKNSQIIGKEIPFSQLPEMEGLQKQIIVGYIDLVLKDNSGTIHIIDYKTNVRPSHLSPAEFAKFLVNAYEIPMNIYGNTLKDVFPQNTIQLKLYHTPTGEIFEYPKDKSSLQIQNYLL